jgi:hypothetical protein
MSIPNALTLELVQILIKFDNFSKVTLFQRCNPSKLSISELIELTLLEGAESIFGEVSTYVFMHADLECFLHDHRNSGDYEDTLFKRFIGSVATKLQ